LSFVLAGHRYARNVNDGEDMLDMYNLRMSEYRVPIADFGAECPYPLLTLMKVSVFLEFIIAACCVHIIFWMPFFDEWAPLATCFDMSCDV
jgi:hypothetical protein